MTHDCPYCKKDMLNKGAHEEMMRVVREYCKRESVTCYGNHNPGGAAFDFSNGKSVQISAYCNWCDYEKVRLALMECKHVWATSLRKCLLCGAPLVERDNA